MTKENNSLVETICAPATPPGRGAVSMVRISGPLTLHILREIFSQNPKKVYQTKNKPAKKKSLPNFEKKKALLGEIHQDGKIIDQVILIFFAAPHSYTTEDLAEIHCHGNPIIVRQIIELLIQKGARPARKGEFTERAFLGGRIDLTQAEAIDSLIRAHSKKEAQIWLRQAGGYFRQRVESLRQRLIDLLADIEAEIDFLEEEEIFISQQEKEKRAGLVLSEIHEILSHGRLGSNIEEGFKIAIIGKPNVGKSSLMNLILNRERSIISHIPGTTRDVVSETVEIGDLAFRFYDTAGLRDSLDTIETIGIAKTRETIAKADFCLFLIDYAAGIQQEDLQIFAYLNENKKSFMIIANKMDLISKLDTSNLTQLLPARDFILFSVNQGMGLDKLEKVLLSLPGSEEPEEEEMMIIQERISALLLKIQSLLHEFISLCAPRTPQEIQAIPLREAIHCLEEITGRISVEDILDSIFGRFCIGK
jgi:tRNA modification GTPase